MSYSKKTSNYSLPQWQLSDTVAMTDFNGAFASIDSNTVPRSRTVNGKALSSNISLSASDVGAIPTTAKNATNGVAGLNSSGKLVQMPTAADVGAVPTSRTINNKALSSNITLTASDVSAVPTTRTVNNKALSSNITLTAADVGAVPTSRTINGQPLTGDIVIDPGAGGFLAAHPVGSLYLSIVSTSPQTLFGGTWVRWANGRVIVGVDPSDSDFNAAEKTGGAKTHTLTVNEMPNHTHTVHTQGGWGAGSLGNNMFRVDTNNPANAWADSSTSATGGGRAHNNMPPYITCYMWKRTA